jgi:hypothetical protein
MAFKWYHGKTGVVWNVTKRAVGVEVRKTVSACFPPGGVFCSLGTHAVVVGRAAQGSDLSGLTARRRPQLPQLLQPVRSVEAAGARRSEQRSGREQLARMGAQAAAGSDRSAIEGRPAGGT